MASIITTISLDPETADIKNRMISNYGFSRWVRECLYRYASAHGEGTHAQERDKRVRGYCNGLLRPSCLLCWPQGPPSKEGWLAFRSHQTDEPPEPRVAYFRLPDDEPEQKAANKAAPRTGLLRRFIRWLV